MKAETKQGSFGSYLFGFLASIVLTLASFYIAGKPLLTGWPLLLALVALGLIQAIIQLILFLYLGKESKPHSNLVVFLFMVLVLCILVIGSLWIMYSLNERVMPEMHY